MAVFTCYTQCAFVLIVFTVTTKTIGGRVTHVLHVLVASIAFHVRRCMFFTQFEFCFVMVKTCRLPVTFGVAIGTLWPQCIGVLIVLFMAGDAFFIFDFENSTFMASLAFCLHMLAQQRECSFTVVEFSRLFPTFLSVAVTTLFAQCFFVLVVLTMA